MKVFEKILDVVCFALGPLIIAYFAMSFLVLLIPAFSALRSGVWIYRIDRAAIGITVGIALILTGFLRRQWSKDVNEEKGDDDWPGQSNTVRPGNPGKRPDLAVCGGDV